MGKLPKIFLAISVPLLLLFIFYLALDRLYLVEIRDQKRKNDLMDVQKALDAYLTYNRSYPESDNISFGRPWKSADVTYMSKLPVDPKVISDHPYCYNNFGNIYLLCAQMEGSQYRCPITSDDSRLCNTCTPSNGKGFYYNYCVYESY